MVGAIVVGTSYGVLTHARAMQQAGITVLGLVGRDEHKANQRAERFGIPHAGTSLKAALDLQRRKVGGGWAPPAPMPSTRSGLRSASSRR